MKCKYCSTINDEDAIFCKKCGQSLNDEDKDNKKNNNKQKNKTKTKVKKKVKKVKVKQKNNKNKKSDKKMSFGQKLLLLIMTLIIIILLGACALGGYYYYNQELNIEVPNVEGLSYKDAELKLVKSNLSAIKVEKEVDDISENDIVIKQNKKQGAKVSKNTKIKLTVGVLKKYTMPNFIGKTLDEAKNELNHNNIKYKIEYKESEKESNIILEQSPYRKTKIDYNEIVTLIVSKTKEKEENIDNEEIKEKEEDKEDITDIE